MLEHFLNCYASAALGFAVYEVIVRIIDNRTRWIKRIGFIKYGLYLLIYGLAIAVVAGGFACSLIPNAALKPSFAVLFGVGLAVPSTFRMFTQLLVETLMKKSTTMLNSNSTPKDIDNDQSKESGNDRGSAYVEETTTVAPPYTKTGYLLGDIFGFSSKL